MTEVLPTQEQVDAVARELAPDVVRIRLQVRQDWSEHDALYFLVILTDEAARRERLTKVTSQVRAELTDRLALRDSNRIPYFHYRTASEQSTLMDATWN